MSESFAVYLSEYLRQHATQYKQYLLKALNSKDHSISFLESSHGMTSQSEDLRNCELLCDAQLFKEKLRLSRNGRNFYKSFQLTELGTKFAEKLNEQSPLLTEPREDPP